MHEYRGKQPESSSLVLYHGGCTDGWCSAYVAHKMLHGWEERRVVLMPIRPDEDVRIEENFDEIFSIDVLPNKRVLDEFREKITCIDHHVTNQEIFKNNPKWLFNLNKSGASLAWEYFFSEARKKHPTVDELPWWVQYVEARDLWKLNLPKMEEISATIYSTEMTIDDWNIMVGAGKDRAVTNGKILLRAKNKLIDQLISTAHNIAFPLYPGAGPADRVVVPCVNAPTFAHMSEVLTKLAANAAFAVGWYVTETGSVRYSLRSTGYDVAKLCEKFGGGGHVKAAGFTFPAEVHYLCNIS